MSAEQVLVAVDGGQTATKGLVARVDGTVLATGRGGPSDHFHGEGGVEKNRRAIHGAIQSALAAAGVDAAAVVAVGIGHTGAPTGGDQNPVIHAIVREIAQPKEIVVVPDYVSNLTGASAGEPGVVLIAGGGSIGYGVTADGREAIAGGFGYLLGDEGSAFKIGLRAISAACFASDLRGEPTALEAIVCEHFGISRMREIPRVVYRAGFSREQISLLAPKVADAARSGDAQAREILADAGRSLALTATGVLRQLYEPGESVAVYMTGGVFKAGDLLLDPFRSALASGWPGAEPREPRFPPVVGALILAARAIGRPTDEAWLDRVSATLETAAG